MKKHIFLQPASDGITVEGADPAMLIQVKKSGTAEQPNEGTPKKVIKKTLKSDLQEKAIALLPRTNSVLKDMKGEDAVNLIAKQAQNVQEDGSVSDLQTPREAYDSAVRSFGKQLVDAAIEANPLISFMPRCL